MSANAETTGAPEGYKLCGVDGCARWTSRCYCWQCFARMEPKAMASPMFRDCPAREPDWTPPIAAPAAHADATPEPAKPCVCPHGHHATDGKCPIHVTAGMESSGFQGCACAKCVPPAQWQANARCGFPIVSSNREAAVTAVGKHQATCEKCSAQEAPKAAPALEWSFTDDEGRKHFFATSNERDAASRAYGAWMKAQTGTPYAGPTRLPRPQLAADWVEDCLPVSGR